MSEVPVSGLLVQNEVEIVGSYQAISTLQLLLQQRVLVSTNLQAASYFPGKRCRVIGRYDVKVVGELWAFLCGRRKM